MKKISLSKETLRVLTAQEATQVAGGATITCIPRAACGESRPVTACETSACPTDGCPPATDTCTCPPPATTNCPPATSDCPVSEALCTETRRRPRCVIP